MAACSIYFRLFSGRLKVGGGYLPAKGVADESSIEAVKAGLVARAGSVIPMLISAYPLPYPIVKRKTSSGVLS